jgi:intracellular multiplication protein IcmJ
MPNLPITLGLSGPIDKAGGASASSFDALQKEVLNRDNHTCQYCGFKAQKYQVVRSISHGKKTSNAADYTTACIFCDQAFEVDRVAAMKSGMLIWLPEIEQAALHHIARAIYVARITQGPTADAARKALEVITQRREEAKNRIRTDDPAILSLVMRDYIDANAYKTRDKKLDGIRIFPLDRRIVSEGGLEFNQFPQILAYWRSKDGPFGAWQPAQWLEDYKALTKAA